MTLHLDPASPVPLYFQIIEQVRRLIAVGALSPGERLPTIRELAVQCRVDRNTAARAVQELDRAGLVRTCVGRGTFVSEAAPGLDPDAMTTILDGHLERLVIEAHSLRFPLEQLPARLWRHIERFRERRRPA